MWTISNNKQWEHLEKHFPWIADMRETPQDPVFHAEGNVAIHTQMVLDALQQEPAYLAMSPQEQEVLWAAALLHDVEKRSTTVFEPDGRISSRGHARKGAQTSRRILYKDTPTPFHIREQIVALVQHHSLPLWLLERPDPLKLAIQTSMEVNTSWLALLARADMKGRTAADAGDMLYRIDCFEEFCKENGCWGAMRSFASDDARMHYLHSEEQYPDYVPFDEPVMEVVMMSGLPGAGKDTYIRKHLKHLPLVSLDDIRTQMRIAPDDKTGNGKVIQHAKEKAKELLRSRQSFVWNATNTTRQMRSQLIELFMAYKAAVHVVYLEVPFAQLMMQNKSREAVVPANVIDKLANKLEVPALTEAHRVTYIV
ncbi:AAA family ATPase [Pseudoflavitalea sp. G-6-1-2]|uniref:AAA family ATPase n=1 Tax=Pseudoflavitalea sp. G-6-1-2 TaxID=2728841 RepID=UPI00146F2103|nr:AAA family ATPase [Pseudoflavitalea sp. G-6-1-2]NML22264.1 AAA family ATPase [Pseudoflavitalea sp. G-6-1-2]